MHHGETERAHHGGHEEHGGTFFGPSRGNGNRPSRGSRALSRRSSQHDSVTAGSMVSVPFAPSAVSVLRLSAVTAAVAALIVATACARAEAPAAPRDYAIEAVPLDAVQIDQGFWSKRMDVNRTVTIPHIMEENERTGRVENFARAAHEASGPYEGRRFNDSDVYKTIEAASYALAKHPDPDLHAKIDRIIKLIAAAQQPDGYLYPARTIDPAHPVAGAGPERWVNLNGSHELYNVGHLYEAAVAYYEATGKRTLLDVAIRNADLMASTFGPQGRKAVPGHEEIEIGLVKLYRVTHDERYLALAKFFLDQRGRPHDTQPYPADSPFAIYNGRPYMQDDVPVTEQSKAEGHAVRAMYLYSGMSDIAALDGDTAYATALDRIWNDVVSKRLYLTGGLGARDTVEAFGDDYELPNRTAYTETCASVGGVLWNQRMFLREGDAKYLDVARAHPLQRLPVGRLARRRLVLLPEPAAPPTGPSRARPTSRWPAARRTSRG